MAYWILRKLHQMNGWNSNFELQPTIYKLQQGDTLRLVLYTTDFEITVRDNSDYQLTVDLITIFNASSSTIKL